jgi:hypothetical protein
MPPRPVTLMIIVLWLGTGIWLFMRDIWPQLRPGEPPAYTLMAADEAPRQGPPVRWNVFHNGAYAYDIEAPTTYREKSDHTGYDDTFEMRARLRAKQKPGHKPPMRRLRSLIRITRGGELREVSAELHIAVADWECIIDVDGPIDEGQVWPKWRVRKFAADDETEARVFDREARKEAKLLRELEIPFPPVDFADHGIIFNPLHPPNRLDGLGPDQHWRMPLAADLLILESLGITLHALSQGERLDNLIEHAQATLGRALAGIPMLEARVLPRTEPLPDAPLMENDELISTRRKSKFSEVYPPICRVIEAVNEDAQVRARLWVQQSEGEGKGLILRQETVFTTENGEEVWVVCRE